MTINEYVTQTYPIECKGRSVAGEEVLNKPVKVKVKITNSGSDMIESHVKCRYNKGAHGERCHAANSRAPYVPVKCPYNFEIPYGTTK